MKRLATTVLASALAATLAGTAFGQTIDGVADPAYGPALAIQDTETGFGDSNLGQVDFANGSELDGAFGLLTGGALYLVFAGNLESNFNKLEIFIDSKPGGENRLLMTNSNQGGFLRMADDGSGNGLTPTTGSARPGAARPMRFMWTTWRSEPGQATTSVRARPAAWAEACWSGVTPRAVAARSACWRRSTTARLPASSPVGARRRRGMAPV